MMQTISQLLNTFANEKKNLFSSLNEFRCVIASSSGKNCVTPHGKFHTFCKNVPTLKNIGIFSPNIEMTLAQKKKYTEKK